LRDCAATMPPLETTAGLRTRPVCPNRGCPNCPSCPTIVFKVVGTRRFLALDRLGHWDTCRLSHCPRGEPLATPPPEDEVIPKPEARHRLAGGCTRPREIGPGWLASRMFACAGIDLIEYLRTIASTLRWIERTREP
jgi:hypothetical protein